MLPVPAGLSAVSVGEHAEHHLAGDALRLQPYAELVQVIAFEAIALARHVSARCQERPCRACRVTWAQLQYSCIGLSTSSWCCSSGVVAMFGIKSTSKPSSGMWSFRLGCGQSVPQSTRLGKVSTM